MSEEQYYGWIFVEEKLPPLGEDVLIAYVEKDVDEKEFVEYLVAKRYEHTVIHSKTIEWNLPQYYRQSCVRAWRKIPVFQIGE